MQTIRNSYKKKKEIAMNFLTMNNTRTLYKTIHRKIPRASTAIQEALAQASFIFTGVHTTHLFSFYCGPRARETPPWSSILHMSQQHTCGPKDRTQWMTDYIRLLFCFGFGCRNRVTARSCLSRFPGIQLPLALGSLALCCFSGLQSRQCALTPISPLL